MKEATPITDKQRTNCESAGDARARRLANLKPFKPGQSGNPSGRPKSALISDAMRHKLTEVDPTDEHKRTYAEVIAAKMVERAASGDLQTAKEVVDRIEGKPRQTVTLTLEQREQYERAVAGMIAETGCTREAAISTLSLFRPEVGELLN